MYTLGTWSHTNHGTMYATWISTDYNIDIGQKVIRFFISEKNNKRRKEKKKDGQVW